MWWELCQSDWKLERVVQMQGLLAQTRSHQCRSRACPQRQGRYRALCRTLTQARCSKSSIKKVWLKSRLRGLLSRSLTGSQRRAACLQIGHDSSKIYGCYSGVQRLEWNKYRLIPFQPWWHWLVNIRRVRSRWLCPSVLIADYLGTPG